MLKDLFFNYSPSVLGVLYFRLGLNLVPESKHPIDIGGVKRVCIMATAGIGNVIMLTPMIRTLRSGIPDIKITVVVATNGAREVLDSKVVIVAPPV